MIVGILKEIKILEKRVCMTPAWRCSHGKQRTRRIGGKRMPVRVVVL